MARNCGLLARDLTDVAFKRGSRGMETFTHLSDFEDIRKAERAITDRISELERENAAQKIRIRQLEAGYDELRTAVKKEIDHAF